MRFAQVHCAYPMPLLVIVSSFISLIGTAGMVSAQLVIQQADPNLIQIDEQFLFRNIFRTVSSESQAASKLQSVLNVQIDQTTKSLDLTPQQRAKLALAGDIDIADFMHELKAAQPAKTQLTQREWSELHAKMQPLQQKISAGLHRTGSLFQKVLSTNLTSEQLEVYQDLEKERRDRQYRGAVMATISMIDGQLPMTKGQREQLQNLLLTKANLLDSMPDDYLRVYAVLYALSTISEDDLKPVFNEKEWVAIRQLRIQGQSMRSMLIQRGVNLQ